MEVTVLSVPDCPNAAVLRARLTAVLAGQRDVGITWREVTDAEQAVRWGMRGSPTLLVNGEDPFLPPGQRPEPTLSCRADGAPTLDQLRTVLPTRRLAPETGGQRAVQQAVLRTFATRGNAPTAAELDAVAAPFNAPAARILSDLDAADYLSVDATGELRAAYPFSPVPTPHTVRIADGPEVWAMCAVDALGIAPMLGTDAGITSTDPLTGEPVTVTFRDGRAVWKPDSAVVFASAGAACGPAVDVCCSTLNFFATADSAHQWAAEHPDAVGEVLSQDEAEALGRAIFGSLLEG